MTSGCGGGGGGAAGDVLVVVNDLVVLVLRFVVVCGVVAPDEAFGLENHCTNCACMDVGQSHVSILAPLPCIDL